MLSVEGKDNEDDDDKDVDDEGDGDDDVLPRYRGREVTRGSLNDPAWPMLLLVLPTWYESRHVQTKNMILYQSETNKEMRGYITYIMQSYGTWCPFH